jgi:glycine/D-amino acid oxidase-like deaminating enzyme
MKSFDVLIVGAGIVGCACAQELAEAGLCVGVGVVEGNIPGSGATAAGMGNRAQGVPVVLGSVVLSGVPGCLPWE